MLVSIPKQKLAFGPFTLVSTLTPAECGSRLEAAIRNERSSLWGSANERSFRVAWRYQPGAVYARNSFKPYLFGRFQSTGRGTVVRCHFTLHPLVLALLVFIACIGAAAVVALHTWTFVVAPVAIVTLGVVVSWGERELLLYDVASAINGRPEG